MGIGAEFCQSDPKAFENQRDIEWGGRRVHLLEPLQQKTERLAIGLMSGTSADGVDAALVRISGYGIKTKVQQIGFCFLPFEEKVRSRILTLADGKNGGTKEVCQMSFLLGELYAEACLQLCAETNTEPSDIDFVGCHGQTVYHLPNAEHYLNRPICGTLQIGEASVIAEKLGCPVVSDFRVRDIAAGGLGAPLVPYTEFLLYRSEERTVALQNIGGIGNITLLPQGCTMEQVIAFDTGPGNMVMDAVTSLLTKGRMTYDEDGRLAGQGHVDSRLLKYMLQDAYLKETPPKTTGRERYGGEYVQDLLAYAAKLNVGLNDVLATATRFTAECIRWAVDEHCTPRPEWLIVGGGGSLNPVLMQHIRDCLPNCRVMVNEELGLDSNAKEAVAFAILANETLFASCNNVPSATGAAHPVVMGKISF